MIHIWKYIPGASIRLMTNAAAKTYILRRLYDADTNKAYYKLSSGMVVDATLLEKLSEINEGN